MKRLPLLLIGLLVIVVLLSLFWTILSVPKEYDLRETKNLAETLLGSNKEAAYSILKAYDSGYSPYQIVQSIDEKRINVFGDVSDATPERAKQNSLILNKTDFLDLFSFVNDDGSKWLTWMLGAVAEGYRGEQITEYMQRRIYSDNEPEDMFGVPIIMGENGDVTVPELPFDWPFKGRNILARLIREDKLLNYEVIEVYVIGLIKAGYSYEQIEEALETDSIGIGSTKNAGSAQSQPTPYYFVDGEMAKPENKTKMEPKDSLVENDSLSWTRKVSETGIRQSRLIPTIVQTPSTEGRTITGHDIVLRLKRHKHKANSNLRATYYEVHVIVKMEGTQSSSQDPVGENASRGDRWEIQGKISPFQEGKHIDHKNLLRADGDYNWEFKRKNASGRFLETLYEDNGKSVSNIVFFGSMIGKMNEDFSVLTDGQMLGSYELKISGLERW